MKTHHIQTISDTVRIRWTYDLDHRTEGSYHYDTPEETAQAEADELSNLESGAWVVLCATVEHRCCECGAWAGEGDQLCGIVIEDNTEAIEEFGTHNMSFALV